MNEINGGDGDRNYQIPLPRFDIEDFNQIGLYEIPGLIFLIKYQLKYIRQIINMLLGEYSGIPVQQRSQLIILLDAGIQTLRLYGVNEDIAYFKELIDIQNQFTTRLLLGQIGINLNDYFEGGNELELLGEYNGFTRKHKGVYFSDKLNGGGIISLCQYYDKEEGNHIGILIPENIRSDFFRLQNRIIRLGKKGNVRIIFGANKAIDGSLYQSSQGIGFSSEQGRQGSEINKNRTTFILINDQTLSTGFNFEEYSPYFEPETISFSRPVTLKNGTKLFLTSMDFDKSKSDEQVLNIEVAIPFEGDNHPARNLFGEGNSADILIYFNNGQIDRKFKLQGFRVVGENANIGKGVMIYKGTIKIEKKEIGIIKREIECMTGDIFGK